MEKEKLDRQKMQEYLEGWRRCRADFENYKKRQEEKQKELTRYAAAGVLESLLPVLDNFYAATDCVPADQKDTPWLTGVLFIRQQLEKVLSEHGLEEISVANGDKFDPQIMEAVEEKSSDSSEKEKTDKTKKDHREQTVKKVVVRGYRINGKILRPARVVVE